MTNCPHCSSALPPGPPPARCASCGHALEKPTIGGAPEPSPDGTKSKPGELLRTLRAVAAARIARDSKRPPPPEVNANAFDFEDVAGTRAYGSRVAAGVVAPAAALGSVSMGSEPEPVPELPPIGSRIARALESLCTRVHAHERGAACVVDLLTLVASADGVIDDAEMEALSSALSALLGGERLPKYLRLLVQSSIDEIHKIGAAETMLRIAEVLTECDASEDGLVMAIAVAYASYGMCAPERAAIRALAGVTGIESERCERLIRDVRAEIDPGGA
jgi:tellurite resistance protein